MNRTVNWLRKGPRGIAFGSAASIFVLDVVRDRRLPFEITSEVAAFFSILVGIIVSITLIRTRILEAHSEQQDGERAP